MAGPISCCAFYMDIFETIVFYLSSFWPGLSKGEYRFYCAVLTQRLGITNFILELSIAMSQTLHQNNELFFGIVSSI